MAMAITTGVGAGDGSLPDIVGTVLLDEDEDTCIRIETANLKITTVVEIEMPGLNEVYQVWVKANYSQRKY